MSAPIAQEIAPIVILAPPRSGTTLLYQAMARSLPVSVMTNLMALTPCIMVRLARFSNARVAGPDRPLEAGTYGFLPGLHGLSEAGKVIDRWFGPECTDRRDDVRAMIAALAARTGRPLLIKSLSLVNRLEALAATLPETRIVILDRDPRFVVQSLFRGQSDPATDAAQWEGTRPEGAQAKDGLSPIEQTAWQVATLAGLLDRAQDLFPRKQVVRLSYERLCAAPAATLAPVAEMLGLAFCASALPESLAPSARRQLDESSWAQIEAACRQHGLAAGFVVDSVP